MINATNEEVCSSVADSIIGIRSPQGSIKGLTVRGCKVLRGDLDYVANQRVIRDCFDFGWGDWERKIRNTLEAARSEVTPLVSLYARTRGLGEAELLERLSRTANDYPDVGVLFHFFDAEGMSHALDIYRGRPLINYVSGEHWALDRALPLLRRHPVPIVAQPIGDMGIPPTATARMEIILHIADDLERVGLDRQDIYVDGLTPALGMLHFPLQVSIETIAAAKEAGFRTILWPANAGLGQPDGKVIAAAYAAMAVQAGLDLAVVALTDTVLCTAIANANLILGRN
jgi:5-methyltetrahydrofolate--homocysteine methyltransferase